MKDAIERLKALDERAKKYYWKDESEVVVKLSDVRLLINFYELHKKESEATPNVPDITPEWDKIRDGFDWVAIDSSGEEMAYNSMVGRDADFFNGWVKKIDSVSDFDYYRTGRKFDMTNIDWTKTLSKRPVKE